MQRQNRQEEEEGISLDLISLSLRSRNTIKIIILMLIKEPLLMLTHVTEPFKLVFNRYLCLHMRLNNSVL